MAGHAPHALKTIPSGHFHVWQGLSSPVSPAPGPPHTPPTRNLGAPAVSSQDVAQTTSANARGALAMCWGHEAPEAPELARGQLPGARPPPAAPRCLPGGAPFSHVCLASCLPAGSGSPDSLLSRAPLNPGRSFISSASGQGLSSRDGGACPQSWNRGKTQARGSQHPCPVLGEAVQSPFKETPPAPENTQESCLFGAIALSWGLSRETDTSPPRSSLQMAFWNGPSGFSYLPWLLAQSPGWGGVVTRQPGTALRS